MTAARETRESIAELADELNAAMEAEAETLAALLQAVAAQREALLNFEAGDVQNELARKQQLVDRLAEQEERRFRVQQRLQELLHCSDDASFMDALKIELTPEQWTQLDETRTRLRHRATELQTENERNTALINQSLQYIEFSLAALGQAAGGRYTPEGKKQYVPQSSRLNQRG